MAPRHQFSHMNNNQLKHAAQTWFPMNLVGLIGISIFLLMSTGCTRPVSNPLLGSRGGGLFGFTPPRLFGGSSTPNPVSGLASVFGNGQSGNTNNGFAGFNGFGGGLTGGGLTGALTGGGLTGGGLTGGLTGGGLTGGRLASGLFGGQNQNQGGFNQSGGFNQGGFNQGGFPGGFSGQAGQGQGFQDPQQFANINSQLQNLNQRLGAYDSDNQLLNTEVAGLTQKLELANQYNQTLKQQLSDTSIRIQQSELEKQSAIQQLASTQLQYEELNQRYASNSGAAAQFAQNRTQSNQGQYSNQTQGQLASYSGNGSTPTQFAGGATIRANNSLMQRFSNINISGGQARMDGDVVRIEFPSDRMFVPGTYQIQPAQLPVLQGIASTIRQNFPKQIIGIEAHWDNTPLNPPTTTHHQLTATQSLAVFDNLMRLGLPNEQLFTMAMGSNRPRHAQGTTNGISPNRRIELVIYPETYDGNY